MTVLTFRDVSKFGCVNPAVVSNLLPTNANLGRIMRIMEMNIWLLERLFVLNSQIFDINI